MSSNRELRDAIKRKRNGPTLGGIVIESSGHRENAIDCIHTCAFVVCDLKDKMLKEYFSFKTAIDALTSKLNELEVLVQKFETFEQERAMELAKSEYDLSTDEDVKP